MGRPEHQKVTQISANPSKRVRMIEQQVQSNIGSGGILELLVYAPTGFIGRVLSMSLFYGIHGGATSGTKSVYLDTSGGFIGLTWCQTAYNAENFYRYGQWEGVNTAVAPANTASQLNALSGASFDEYSPLKVSFQNSTNANDAGTIKLLRFWVEEEKIT